MINDIMYVISGDVHFFVCDSCLSLCLCDYCVLFVYYVLRAVWEISGEAT